MTWRVTTIGYGAIGSAIVEGLARSQCGPYRQAGFVGHDSAVARLPSSIKRLADGYDLIVWTRNLVIEAAASGLADT